MSTRSLGILAGIGIVSFISLTLNQNWHTNKPYAQIVANDPAQVALEPHTHTIDSNPDLSNSVVAQASPKPKLMVDLNLSKTQKQQIELIRRQYQPQIAQLKSDLSVAQQQLSEMMYGTEEVETISLKHQQVVELRNQIETLRFESILQMREVLTIAQRTQLGQILRDRQAQPETEQQQSAQIQP